MAFDLKSQPNVITWPPLIYAVVFLCGLLLERFAPTGVLPPPSLVFAGKAIVALGLGLDFWAMATMILARTNILPNRAAERLVTSGPFAFTRNPIYLGNTLLMLGIGLAWEALWFLPLAFCAAILVEKLAIRREEAHLAIRLGPEWETYAATTPRWPRWIR